MTTNKQSEVSIKRNISTVEKHKHKPFVLRISDGNDFAEAYIDEFVLKQLKSDINKLLKDQQL